MMLKCSTQVPNIVFDKYLPGLKESELKVLLIIIRQTFGWVNLKTGKRKVRDRISHSQFGQKTGLSRKVISRAIQSLIDKKLINVSDYEKNLLHLAQDRKGRTKMLYSMEPVYFVPSTCVHSAPGPVYNYTYNKTNYTKETNTKLRGGGVKSVGEILSAINY